MPDVFISYSRRDSEQALALFDRLIQLGLDVWMDRTGLTASEMYGGQIVEAIDGCRTFVVLLSPNSIESHNVLKEVSIASERRKRIFPLEIAPVTLPSTFEYPLAGIQRMMLTTWETAIEAIMTGRMAGGNSYHSNPVKRDPRKALIVLPFEDLSPSQDNAWFADGLTSEIINALSHVKALRIVDRKTTMEYKGYRGKTVEIARDLGVRYFLEGTVRKFGDQIKIMVELLDIEAGETLWSDAHKGSFADIFDIQEQVAQKVVDALKVQLTHEEHIRIRRRDTAVPAAFELFLRAQEYAERHTLESLRYGIQLCKEATDLDPHFTSAYVRRAILMLGIYQTYERNEALLREAEAIVQEVLRRDPGAIDAYQPLAQIELHRNRPEEAIRLAREYIERSPDDEWGYFTLGAILSQLVRCEESAPIWEKFVKMSPHNLVGRWNLYGAYNTLGNTERRKEVATEALPYFHNKHRRFPDDEVCHTQYLYLLLGADKRDEVLSELAKMERRASLDGIALYNLACLYARLGEREKAVAMLTRSKAAGLSVDDHVVNDPDFDTVRDMPEYQELLAA